MAPVRYLFITPIFLLFLLLVADGAFAFSTDPNDSDIHSNGFIEDKFDELIDKIDELIDGLNDGFSDFFENIIDWVLNFLKNLIMFPLRFLEKIAFALSDFMDLLMSSLISDEVSGPGMTSLNMIKAFAYLLIFLLIGRIYVLVLDYLPVA